MLVVIKVYFRISQVTPPHQAVISAASAARSALKRKREDSIEDKYPTGFLSSEFFETFSGNDFKSEIDISWSKN